jgi:hypothetical protein
MFEFKTYKNEGGNLNLDLLNLIRNTFDAKIFIETGTYNGGTTQIAANIFDKIYSVELGEKMFNDAIVKFNNISNVELYLGSSDQILNNILPLIKDRVILWLDAHYCGENTAFGNSMTPIREELEAIKSHNIKNCIIMIDDIRIFNSSINGKEYIVCDAYPTFQWINGKLLEINPNFNIILVGDILIAYDKKVFDVEISDIVKACTLSRLYDGTNYSDQELYDAETKLINIMGNEYKIINKIADDQYNLPLNTTLHNYYLWAALSNIKNNPSKSIIELKNIQQAFNHPNIEKYINMAYNL